MITEDKERWVCYNPALSTAQFTVDLSLSEDVWFEDEDREMLTKTIKIESGKEDRSIKIIKTADCDFNPKLDYKEIPHAIHEQKHAIKQKQDQHYTEAREIGSLFKGIPYEALTQDEIVRKMRELKIPNFVDPHFPPAPISLYNIVKDQYPFNYAIQWRRPHEFMDDPQLFVDGVDPNDIKQGELGNCWFLSALAALAERPGLVKRLFITEEYNKEGVYKLRFCKNGEWVEVTIDDYIPCRMDGGPAFSFGCANELWVLLVEKAYAKLHGNYEALSGGITKESMIDLTGCPAEFLNFPQRRDDNDFEDECNTLFNELKEADDSGYLILASTGGVDNTRDDGRPQGTAGLVSGHAYSVIQVKEGKGERLLNIRNPWGEFEWDGPWSDSSPYWTEEMIEEFNPRFDDKDGSFWMSLEDFVSKFEEVSVCKVENYNEVRFKGKFIKGTKGREKAESVVSKFYYAFTIEEDTEMTIGIHQEDERIVGAHLRRYLDIGFTVLRVSEENDEVHIIELCPLEREREVFKLFILTRGSYVVVPITAGAYLQNGSQALTAEIPPKIEFENSLFPHPYYNSTLNDIFRKLDLAVNDLLSVEELNQFGVIIDEPFFKNITYQDFTSEKFKDISCNEYGVTCLGFKQLLFRFFSSAEITRFMEILGYDVALNSTKSRSFMISFQSDLPMMIKIKDIQ